LIDDLLSFIIFYNFAFESSTMAATFPVIGLDLFLTSPFTFGLSFSFYLLSEEVKSTLNYLIGIILIINQ
jgi:hypothetical protein